MARRNEEMKFVYPGPFGPQIDGRIGRSFVKPARDFVGRVVNRPYSATSPEDYSIGAALSQKEVALVLPQHGGEVVIGSARAALEEIFGREQDSSGRRPRRRGGRGRKKVTA